MEVPPSGNGRRQAASAGSSTSKLAAYSIVNMRDSQVSALSGVSRAWTQPRAGSAAKADAASRNWPATASISWLIAISFYCKKLQ